MPALSFRHVGKTYAGDRGEVTALDDVSFDIEPGEFFGLLGPNGAGKTTLISILAGLARATSGTVTVMGHDVVADYAAARRSLGIVPQELVFDPFFSVRETLRIQSGYFGVRPNTAAGRRANDAWIDELLENLGLTDKAGANLRQLSGGMKRRVLVAQALVHKPPVIVLDEPTAGVDVELRQTLWQFISRLNREGHTIVLTTHYLEEAQALCKRIAMLQHGRVVALESTASLLARFDAAQLILHFSQGHLPEVLLDRAVEPETALTSDRVALRLAAASEVETMLASCRAAGAVIDQVAIQRADLEDVFVQIMGGAHKEVYAEPDAETYTQADAQTHPLQ